MRKIIVSTFLSLDGVLQGPGGTDEDLSNNFKYSGWTVPYFDKILSEVMAEQMKQPFDLLLGRITYGIFAAHWPYHAEEWQGINESTKYVVSNQSLEFNWDNSVQLKGNIMEEVKKIKSKDGPNLYVYGSSRLIQTLFQHDLVDELWLKIFPITLGKGKRLFAEGTISVQYKLEKSKVTPEGVVIVNYTRNGDVQTGTFV